MPSTGFLACLLLLAADAAEIDMRGFSFEDGHSYLETAFKRGHVARDREVMLKLLEAMAPVAFPFSPIPNA